MHQFLRSSLALVAVLAFLPAAHAFEYSKISLSGSIYQGTDSAPVGVATAAAQPKTKVPLTNKSALTLCGLDPGNASDYQVVIGIDDSQNFGIFVVLKSTGATVGTLLTYTTYSSGDGTKGFYLPGNKGYVILPVLSIVGSTKISGVLAGQATNGINTLKITATVDDGGNPHFALIGRATVFSTFQPQAP